MSFIKSSCFCRNNKNSVALQVKVGKKSQGTSDLADNALVIIKSLIDKLPNGFQNLHTIYIKSTMSKTIKNSMFHRFV